MNSTRRSEPGSFALLRNLARKRTAAEYCELCSAALASEHEHLIEPATRRLLCSCTACAILFSGKQYAKFRRVPRRIQLLSNFRLTDGQWEELHLPINLAFFLDSTPAGRVVAAYPSPAGATESLLTLESWQCLVEENTILREMEPDVEALLVNRVGRTREHFLVPIDECYKLVGLLRMNWRGLSGGAEVWAAIGRFFADLKQRSGSEREAADA